MVFANFHEFYKIKLIYSPVSDFQGGRTRLDPPFYCSPDPDPADIPHHNLDISHERLKLAKFPSERNARGEQLFDDRGLWHETLKPEIEDSLERLLGEGAQHLQLVQDATEVMLLLLRVRVVCHVISQRVDDLGLQTLHLLRLQQPMAL